MELNQFKRILSSSDIEFSENSSHIILKVCPNCGGKDKLNVSKGNYLWQCFKCKGLNYDETSKGNLFSLLKYVFHLDNYQVMKLIKTNELVDYVPEVLVQPSKPVEVVENKQIQIEPYQIPSHWPLLDCSANQIQKYPDVYKYLISRFVDRKTILKYELRYDQVNMRLVFPAKNLSGQCIGVQTRDITERYKQTHPKCQNFKCSLFRKYYWFQKMDGVNCPACEELLEESFYPKASNSKNFPKTEFFFGENKIDWNQPVVLVEGPFDVINTPNAIGLLGRTLSTTQQWILINNIKNKLILFLDGDSAGDQSTVDVYNKLSLFIDKLEICYLDGQDDPGSHGLETNAQTLTKLLKPYEWLKKKKIFI